MQNISISDNTLIINVEDNTLYSLLKDGEREIERALSWQGVDLKIDIAFVKKNKSKQDQDVEKLINIFSKKLIVKK